MLVSHWQITFSQAVSHFRWLMVTKGRRHWMHVGFILMHTHSCTHWLDISMETRIIVQMQMKLHLLFTTWKWHAHTHSTLLGRFDSAICLFNMLKGHELAFSHPLPACMCGWFVWLHLSVYLSLHVWPSVWKNVMKMMALEKTMTSGQWETEGRKRRLVFFSLRVTEWL